jgi:hypothetical protein
MRSESILDAIDTALRDSWSARRAFRLAVETTGVQLPQGLQLVGSPGARPFGGLQTGDVVIRVNPGEPVAPFVGRIMSEATWSHGGTWDAEASGPGFYANTRRMSGPPSFPAARGRLVLDARGQVPPNQIVLRGMPIAPRQPFVPPPVAPAPIASPVSAQPLPGPVMAEPDQPFVGEEPTDAPELGLHEPVTLEQTCATEGTQAEQVNWWDAELAEDALIGTAPAELRRLLAYLHVSWPTFADHEGRYFAALGEHLRREGVIRAGLVLNRSNFTDPVRQFQITKGLGADGIPGEQMLWTLQKDWAENRCLTIVRVDADRHPRSRGFDSFRLRSDIVDRYTTFRATVRAAGGLVTSAGSLRELEAEVTPGRSSTSMHYSGLAFDLATDSGMQDPELDPYIVVQEGERWRVWCRSQTAPTVVLNAVAWHNGSLDVQPVTANAFDLTALARRHGFSPIGPRRDFPANYLSAEWWHLQCEEPLVPYISQFGIELLSIDTVGRIRYDEPTLSMQPLWANRMRIFHRGLNGWW